MACGCIWPLRTFCDYIIVQNQQKTMSKFGHNGNDILKEKMCFVTAYITAVVYDVVTKRENEGF